MTEPRFTIAEVGRLLNRNTRRLYLQAREKNWQGVETPQGVSYSLSQFPQSWRFALAKLASHEGTTVEIKASTGASTPRQSVEVSAWFEIFESQENWCKCQSIDKVVDCDSAFAAAYNSGVVEVSAEARAMVPSLSRSTLARKRAKLRQQGTQALARQSSKRGTLLDNSPELRDFVIAFLVEFPDCNPKKVWQGLEARFGDLDFSRETLRSFIASWRADNKEVLTAIRNPDEWKNRYMVGFGSFSDGVDRPNQLWEFDSSPADLMLKEGRYALVGVIDVATRRQRLLVAKTSKAAAIVALFRWCLLNWGIPEQIKTDNGKDYTAKHLERVLWSFEPRIIHGLCQPFSPWQKPHIERGFRTFSHDLIELMPNFLGHNVAERRAIESRKSFADRLFAKNSTVELSLSAAEFQDFCDRWCEGQLHQTHEGLNGRTPFEVLTSYQGELRRLPKGSERSLDLLLAAAPDRDGWRTVQKRGVAVEGGWFIAAELAALVGERVQVRLDPFDQDMGRVYVFDASGEFICLAENVERLGVNRGEVAQLAKAQQRKRVQEQRQQLKTVAKTQNVGGIAEAILAKRQQPKVVAFPQPSDEVPLPVSFTNAASAQPVAAVQPLKPVEPARASEFDWRAADPFEVVRHFWDKPKDKLDRELIDLIDHILINVDQRDFRWLQKQANDPIWSLKLTPRLEQVAWGDDAAAARALAEIYEFRNQEAV